ncbi:hypothetical protein LEGAS_0663 [Leuconostoc gasicomitatum LMG 18811]|nr:hypothetical protein LEGAS_0663 [Leuconostoc gasicomitatum LMG 18811]CUW08213.1 hypothetical protein C120C_1359 [Leuconostoc inhae]
MKKLSFFVDLFFIIFFSSISHKNTNILVILILKTDENL